MTGLTSRLLAGGAAVGALCWLAAPPASAQGVDPSNGYAVAVDPTAFHITGPGAGSSQDPVIIQSSTSFQVIDNSGANTQSPVTLYFAVPVFSGITPVVPTVSLATFNSSSTPLVFSSPMSFIGNFNSTPPKDLYSFANNTCLTINNACDNSVTLGNMIAAEQVQGLGTPTGFNVYGMTINQAFTNKDDTVNVTGNFAQGDIVIPLAEFVDTSGKKETFYDTSWTNTGFFDATPKCTGDCVPVPEPSSLALLGGGAAMLGLGLLRRQNRS